MRRMSSTAHRTLLAILFLLPGCAAQSLVPEGDDPYKGHISSALSGSERWTLPAATRTRGEMQRGTYDAAPAWNSGRNCTGSFLSGTRALGDYLDANFAGVGRYEGYNCRQNTADRTKTSMHGTGRAIDIFIPLASGQADNSAGDPVANWLVEHAQEIGVQFIIWDRTKWSLSASGRKDSAYGGPHPHHDHLHVELTIDGANGRTPWFVSRMAEPAPAPEPEPEPALDPACNDACPYANDGECDDGGPGSAYSLCELGSDCADCGRADREAVAAPAPSGLCSDTCRYAGDGACDDGGPGSSYAVCALGTDCTDCGAREPVAAAPELCTDECTWANDGACDDGGAGSAYSVCALGTDCGDCGPREIVMCADVQAACDTAACCGSLSCRRGATFGERCCVEAAQACTSNADCCGTMACVGGTCACRTAGSPCVEGGDCCSGTCNAGTCAP
jgi:hypothetical protein